jgi:membrane protein implicated in regulation of membrane protease activity
VSKIKEYFSPLNYTIYAIIGTLLEQGAVVIIFRWWLPQMDIHVSWYVTGIVMFLLLIYSFYTYIMGRKALLRKSMFYPEVIVGSEGVVATPLDPTGYVKVKGELWKATSTSDLEIGDRIVVTRIDGIRLIVVPEAQRKKGPQHNG